LRHPEKAVSIERFDFYDREQFLAFYAGLQARKKSKVLPTDPELYGSDVEDRISINQATEWFHFAGPGVIRKYLKANPGYFPDSVGTVEGPTGRQIPAFRRGDLQDFDRKRTGDTTGRPGARPAPSAATASPRPSSASPTPSPSCARTATTVASPPSSPNGTTSRTGSGSAPQRNPQPAEQHPTLPPPPPAGNEPGGGARRTSGR
jgi:hypothetical protein